MKPETIKEICKAHLEVEQEYGINIDEVTTREILSYCIRKLKHIRKDEDYLPILYKCELPMQLAIKEINKLSKFMYEEMKGGEGYVFGMSYESLPLTMPQCT